MDLKPKTAQNSFLVGYDLRTHWVNGITLKTSVSIVIQSSDTESTGLHTRAINGAAAISVYPSLHLLRPVPAPEPREALRFSFCFFGFAVVDDTGWTSDGAAFRSLSCSFAACEGTSANHALRSALPLPKPQGWRLWGVKFRVGFKAFGLSALIAQLRHKV